MKKLRGEALNLLCSAPISEGVAPVSLAREQSTSQLMEEVLCRSNLQLALKQVINNKGCAGPDGMSVFGLSDYLRAHWPRIRQQLFDGKYTPSPVRRATIPKAGGGQRHLGIPNVVDRLIQQAINQVLTRIIDPTFSESSFGFRPGRSAHDALNRSREYVQCGFSTVVDIDLEQFFDTVNHDRLMSRLCEHIADKRILKLIRLYLKAGILVNGIVSSPTEGTPQGGPLSPLLSNVVLDELDKELEARGHRFSRYADDCNIYVASQRAGERVKASIEIFISKRLKLRVNAAKSAVAHVSKRKFLGFTIKVSEDDKAHIEISASSISRFKDRIRELTQRSTIGMDRRIQGLSRFIVGWLGYYRLGESRSVLKNLDQYIRRRLRMLHLKQWRTPSTRWRAFERLGMARSDLKFITHTTKRYWYLSKSRAVNFTLNLNYFRRHGLIFMDEAYAS